MKRNSNLNKFDYNSIVTDSGGNATVQWQGKPINAQSNRGYYLVIGRSQSNTPDGIVAIIRAQYPYGEYLESIEIIYAASTINMIFSPSSHNLLITTGRTSVGINTMVIRFG